MALSFETVIGLEVHVQLATGTKLFCPCPTDYIGREPNTLVCPVCLGLPGTLPSLNVKAVQLGVKVALALGCSVSRVSRFDRKHYFYPDLPKAFQVSQLGLPLALGGAMPVSVGDLKKTIGITRLHLEEDAGKQVHGTADGRLSGSSFHRVDYNRAGIPLAEIVSEPDMSTPLEAREYVLSLRRLVRYLGASDGDMESGSLRVDVNVSQKCSDGRWGGRVEIKNVNSVRAMERALEFEISRQREILLAGGRVKRETRHWDDLRGVTRATRGKEEAQDYRYFPEPDLPPLVIDDGLVRAMEGELPELPWEKRERFQVEWGLSPEDSATLSERLDLAEFLEETVRHGASRESAANWVKTDVLRILNETRLEADRLPFTPRSLGALLMKVDEGSLSNTAARDVLEFMRRDGLGVEEAMQKAGAVPGGVKGDQLAEVVRGILAAHPEEAGLVLSGADPSGKKRKYLQGLVMREIRGQAPPGDVSAAIDEALDQSRGPKV